MKTRVLAITVLFLLGTGVAHAAIVNGGFETGNLSGWDVFASNYASVVTSSVGSGPTEGTYEAYLRTPTSGIANVLGLNAFVGLNIGSLTGLGNGVAIEGTAIRQSIFVNAGDSLSFDFNFLTNSPKPEQILGLDNDFGFVSLVGLTELGDAVGADTVSPTVFDYETGFGPYSYKFGSSGWYTLAIGVVDVIPANLPGSGDESALLVDNVTLQTVPEPATLSLFGVGLGGMIVRYVRRRKA